MRAVAIRCDGCGEEFVIGHQPAFVDKKIAEKQAAWLEKVLAEEHSIVQPGCTRPARCPKEKFKHEVEKELTGRETEAWEIIYSSFGPLRIGAPPLAPWPWHCRQQNSR